MKNIPCRNAVFAYAFGVILCMSAGSASAWVFNCEDEMQVNTVFGNRAPLTEANAQKAGWTKMDDLFSVFHSENGLRKLLLKRTAMYPLEVVETLRGQLQTLMGESNRTPSQLQDWSDLLDSVLGINHKYISPNGKHEAVYQPDTGKLVNQGKYVGTYNKHSPQGFLENVKHGWTSVAPHLLCVVLDDYVWDPTTQCFIVSKTGQQIDVSCDTGQIAGTAVSQDATNVGQSSMSDFESQQPLQGVASATGTSYSQPGISPELAALAGQVSAQIGEIQAQRHECTSFEYVKDYIGADRKPYMSLYRCTECGQGTTVNVREGETIEMVIEENKRRAAMFNQSYGFAQSALQGIAGGTAPSANAFQQTQENP